MDLSNFNPLAASPDTIKAVQSFLAERVFYPRVLGIDANFGDGSKRALAAYQAAWTERRDLIDFAVTQIGVTEVPQGSNNGPFVNMYQDDNGGDHGESWCADFVCWCLRRLVHENSPTPNIIPPRTRLAWGFADWARTVPGAKVLTGKVVPQRNDIVEYTFSHVGIVKDFTNGILHAVEGNTNADGSREGYEVILHPRYLSNVKALIRVPQLS